jgi:hypothetical protein
MWHVWRKEKCRQDLVGKPEGKRPFERPRGRWKNMKAYLKETG